MMRRPSRYTRTDRLFTYTTLFRSDPRSRKNERVASALTPPALVGAATEAQTVSSGNRHEERCVAAPPPPIISTLFRSEEHTSELQSLMRISYAVFCLKNNKHN